MRVLYMASEWVPFSYPEKINGGGGVSTLEPLIIDSLKSEHEVDFLVPSDSFVTKERKDVLWGDFPSKRVPSKSRSVIRTRNMLDVAHKYDVIFLNDSRLSIKYLDELKSIAPKIRFVNHSHPEGYTGAFTVLQYHIHWVLAQYGAVVSHVQPDLDQYLEKHLESIKKNPYLISGEPFGTFGDKFNHIDLLTTDEEAFSGDLTSENLWVAVGRGSKDKRIKFALESWIEAKTGGQLTLCVQDPQQKDNELPEIKKIADSRSDVELIVDASRSQVFNVLRKARGCIFPSTRESMGLVPFEANCCGVPVVYTIEQSHRFLEPIGVNLRVQRRTKKGYAEKIKLLTDNPIDKHKVREKVHSLFPPERIKSNVLNLVRKTA